MGSVNSKTPAPSASLRPREVILGCQKIPKRSRRRLRPRNRPLRQLGEMESQEVPRDIRAALRSKSLTGSIQLNPIHDLVPKRTTSIGCTQYSWSDGEAPQLGKRCDLQQRRLIDKRREIRQLRCQLESLEGKRYELESKNGELAELTQDLKSKAVKLESEITELGDKAVKLEGRKDELEAEFLISNVDERTLLDDGAVKDRWAGLENTILNIVIERFSHPPDAGAEEAEEIFADFVAEPRAWLQSERREWLFQAFIWNALVERVFGEYGFSAHGYNLSGENWRVYSEYLCALRDECSKPGGITRLQYQKLKAAMNMILAPTKRPDASRITEVVAEIEDELLPFQSPFAKPEECPLFQDLVRDAVALDADMARCRAWYQISMYDFGQAGDGEPQVEAYGMDFNSLSMHNVLHGRGQKVSLVVSPLLVKWGDLDGRNFGNSIVLAPKGVITTE